MANEKYWNKSFVCFFLTCQEVDRFMSSGKDLRPFALHNENYQKRWKIVKRDLIIKVLLELQSLNGLDGTLSPVPFKGGIELPSSQTSSS